MQNRPFSLGRLVATPNVIATLSGERIVEIICRHLRQDWGIVGKNDWVENNLALIQGTRILSAYYIDELDPGRGKVWVITEADRTSTCILLPEEY